MPADGNLTLFEHIRELRYRLIVAVVALVVGMIVCLVFHKFLFEALTEPYNRAVALAKLTRPDIKTELILSGAISPFTVTFKIAAIGGLVLSAPIWLYQVWAFIVPGLLAKEKKWSLIVIGAATPLFVGGVGLAYYVIPNGLAALIKFTPENLGISNLQSLSDFLNFMTRLMLVFGLAFEIPLFILMLNLVGILPAKMISKYRSYLIFAVFVFAAIATPSPDAITMLLLALPMTVLVIVAEVLAHIFDRRKSRRLANGDVEFRDSLSEDKALAALSATPEPEPVRRESKPATLGDAFGLKQDPR